MIRINNFAVNYTSKGMVVQGAIVGNITNLGTLELYDTSVVTGTVDNTINIIDKRVYLSGAERFSPEQLWIGKRLYYKDFTGTTPGTADSITGLVNNVIPSGSQVYNIIGNVFSDTGSQLSINIGTGTLGAYATVYVNENYTLVGMFSSTLTSNNFSVRISYTKS